jgi:hypothetical protein
MTLEEVFIRIVAGEEAPPEAPDDDGAQEGEPA